MMRWHLHLRPWRPREGDSWTCGRCGEHWLAVRIFDDMFNEEALIWREA